MNTQYLEELKQRLINKAKYMFGRIYPCGFCTKFDDCFTMQNNTLCFWFVTEDKNTHMLRESTSNSLWSTLVDQAI
jgi:hypothetical protein